MSDFPFSHLYDFASLSQAGADVHIALKSDGLEKLAQWAGVDAADSFAVDIALKKLGQTEFAFEAHWRADIRQTCVVTLEALKTHLSGTVARELKLIRRARRRTEPADLPPPNPVEEGPEEIDNPVYDLAVPVLEDFALSVDPYPRKAGVSFESPVDTDAKAESPFAALKDLKIGR